MQKIQDIQSKSKNFLQKLTAKKIFTGLACLLLVLLPTIFALFYVQYTNYTYHSDQFTVTLYDQHGVELITESGNPEKATSGSMVGVFYQIQTKKTPLAKAPTSLENDTFIVAKISLNDVSSELKCYFSTEDSKGYCIDQTGKFYSIPSEQNESFLLSSYSELFYESAIIPSLITIDGDTILPFSNEWYYQAVDGRYLLAEKNENHSDHILYEITGALGIQFDTHPNECIVSVYKDQRLYQTCGIDELSSIPVDVGTNLTIDIQAEWTKSNHRDYYGTVHYNFDVEIRNPSTFSINTNTIKTGELLLLTCTNISDPQKIKFYTSHSEFDPIFEWDSKTATAHGILPIPSNTSLQNLNFQLSYGASTRSFDVTIEKTIPVVYSTLAWNTPSQLLSLDQFQSDLSTSLAYRAPITVLHHFRGNFLDPQESGFELRYHHGDRLKINGEYFTAYGTEFTTAQTTDVSVSAWNHGMVLDTGRNSSIGNFIIIDHGCGLRTIYGALGRIDVEPGEIVQKGQQIGCTSTNTRSGDNGFLVFCTVGSTIINPIYVMGKELNF